MTHTQQIEEAVKDIEENGIPNAKVGSLLDCFKVAQEYLAVKGMPEERYCDLLNTPNTAGGVVSPGCLLGLADEIEKQRLRNNVIETDAFNQSLHLCRLAHAKNCQECRERVPTIEDIYNELITQLPMPEYLSIPSHKLRKLSEVIHALITGKRGGK